MNHQPVISIIVPIHNAERTLDKCLFALQHQTYNKLEVLLLNDGSTDNSSVICQNYASQDNRFIFHDLEPYRNVAIVRNIGLQVYTGDYLMFADADDIPSPNYVERLYEVICSSGCDVATCIACDSYDTSISHYEYDQKQDIRIIKTKDYDFTKHWSHRVVWGAIFKRDIIGSHKFNPQYPTSTDTLFMAELLKDISKVAHVDEPLYMYIIYPNSISHSQYDWKRFSNVLVWEDIATRIFADGPELPHESSEICLINSCMLGLKELSLQDNPDKDLYNLLMQKLKSRKSIIKSLGHLGTYTVFKALLAVSFPHVYLFLQRVKHFFIRCK